MSQLRTPRDGTIIQTTTQQHRPAINTLTVANICAFNEKTGGRKLTTEEQAALATYFTKSARKEALQELAADIDKFNDMYAAYYFLSPGLNNKQIKQLVKLKQEMQKLKIINRERKGTRKSVLASYMAGKKYDAFEKNMAWHQEHTLALNRPEVWERFKTSLQEVPPANKAKYLKELSMLKKNWLQQKKFAGYSSADLLNFYESIIYLEQYVQNEFAHRHPPLLQNYLTSLLEQVQQLKLQAIYSMLLRLLCAEFFKEFTCDDILVYMRYKLRKIGLNIESQDQDRKLAMERRGLTAAYIVKFIGYIDTFRKQTSNALLLESLADFDKLAMRTVPVKWRTLAKEQPIAANLAQHPVIVYFEHCFPLMLESANKLSRTPERSLAVTLLDTDNLNNKLFTINRMRHLLQCVQSEFQQIVAATPALATNNAIADRISEYQKKYADYLSTLNNQVIIEMSHRMNQFLDDLFGGKELAPKKIDGIINKIRYFGIFKRKFMHEDYSLENDLILQTAQRLGTHLTRNPRIQTNYITNIVKLIAAMDQARGPEDNTELTRLLTTLPELARRLNGNDEAEDFIHLLVNFLETPLGSTEEFYVALRRHKHIAATHHGRWNEALEQVVDGSPQQKSNAALYSYLKQVMLRVIRLNIIDPGNFDQNAMSKKLSELEKNGHNREDLATVRAELEAILVEKLNHLPLIKGYLCPDPDNTTKINVERLESLLLRITAYFTHTEHATVLIKSISKAVFQLIKNYCLDIIEKEALPDFSYIDRVSALLKTNVLQELRQDAAILTLLRDRLCDYDGTKSNLSRLLTELFSTATGDRDAVVTYAKKRLRQIQASRSVSTEDYYFFAHFSVIPDIAGLVTQYKEYLKSYIHKAIADPASSWCEDAAHVIELLGNPADITTYRIKRITELLLHDQSHPLEDKHVQLLFQNFIATVNRAALNKRLLPSDAILPNNDKLHVYLDRLVQACDWTLMQEYFIRECGTKQQIQDFHIQFFAKRLNKGADPSTTWLGKEVLVHAKKMQELDQMAQIDNQSGVEIDYYRNYFGSANLNHLCALVERVAAEIQTAINHINANTLADQDYSLLMGKIACIKAMHRFYMVCHTTMSPPPSTLTDIDEVEKKICLHYELHALIKQQTAFFDSSEQPTTTMLLAEIFDAIIAMMDKIERNQILNDLNINDYLLFFNNSILTQIQRLLFNDAHLSYQALATLSNILTCFVSDHLKRALVKANTNDAKANPYWLHLINHLDESKTLRYLDQIVKENKDTMVITPEFNNTFIFAKNLSSLKRHIKTRIKKELLAEAGIQLDEAHILDLRAALTSDSIEGENVLALWKFCTAKFQDEHLPFGVKTNYLHFLTKFLAQIGAAIVDRTRLVDTIYDAQKTDARFILINEFYKQLPSLQRIKHCVNEHSMHVQSPAHSHHSAMFTDVTECVKFLQPLLISFDQALALRLTKSIEVYLLKMMQKQRLAAFRKLSNECLTLSYDNGVYDSQINIGRIKQDLGVKDNFKAEQLSFIIRINSELLAVANSTRPMQTVEILIERILQDAQPHAQSAHTRHYLRLLEDMQTQLQQHTAMVLELRQAPIAPIQNDRMFATSSANNENSNIHTLSPC